MDSLTSDRSKFSGERTSECSDTAKDSGADASAGDVANDELTSYDINTLNTDSPIFYQVNAKTNFNFHL